MDIASSLWAWLQTLPFWAIFGITAAGAALIFLPELFMSLWNRKRIKNCRRQWDEYNQYVRDYRQFYKNAKTAAYCDWLEWKEGFQSQKGALPSLYLTRMKRAEFERARLAAIGPEPIPPSGWSAKKGPGTARRAL
jgi:hypothetical protein